MKTKYKFEQTRDGVDCYLLQTSGAYHYVGCYYTHQQATTALQYAEDCATQAEYVAEEWSSGNFGPSYFDNSQPH